MNRGLSEPYQKSPFGCVEVPLARPTLSFIGRATACHPAGTNGGFVRVSCFGTHSFVVW